MAIPHAQPGQVIDIGAAGEDLKSERTAVLIKTASLEVIRLVVPAGKEIGKHRVNGEIILQCIEGKILFRVGESEREVTAGKLLYLTGSEEHSLRAVEDSSLLLTILLEPARP